MNPELYELMENIGIVGNDILEVKLHVGYAWEVYGLNGRCERMR